MRGVYMEIGGWGVFELASPTGKSFRFVRAWRDATRDHLSTEVLCAPDVPGKPTLKIISSLFVNQGCCQHVFRGGKC